MWAEMKLDYGIWYHFGMRKHPNNQKNALFWYEKNAKLREHNPMWAEMMLSCPASRLVRSIQTLFYNELFSTIF